MADQLMPAVRLHGPRDLRFEQVPHPGVPPAGSVLLRVEVVGICGSDLHTYRHATIGDTQLSSPLILGHEFAGRVEQLGGDSPDGDCLGGDGQPLRVGMPVAVDPARSCGRCEWCLRGDPNLCPHIVFCGLWPDQGALCPWMHVPASTCFPVPSSMDATTATMLEPFGVAIHAVDLAHLRPGHSVAVIGTGPIGLCILRLAVASGAGPAFAADRLPWRVDLAERFGPATAFCTDRTDIVSAIMQATGGRGVDVAFEAADGGETLQQAAEILAPGGCLMALGIDEDDRFQLRHSTLRRKGLTIRMVRRMKHTYERSMRLVQRGTIDLNALVSHRFPLQRAAEAFALNSEYRDGAVKVVIDI
jgi:L-iditol 2-dehydrogenase